MPPKIKLDPTLLTEEQRTKLETWQTSHSQLQSLEDIASMTQELVNLFDKQQKSGDKNIGDVGALLVDMRESLDVLKNKEAPPLPDFARPVVNALTNLEKSFGLAFKSLDLKPNITVDAPAVNVSPPSVDLKGVEKILKSDLPKAFQEAIGLIPTVDIPETDFQPLLDAWSGISEQLLSIENATRMKPLPGKMNVTNPDGSLVAIPFIPYKYDYIAVTPGSTTDTYKFYSGGLVGTLVSTVVLTYTDSTKSTLANVART